MWIDDFFELLYSNDSKKIENAYELKNQKIPDFLYKYKSIDENGYTFDLLENDLIYLSDANNLNDLYEGEFFYDELAVFDALLDKYNFFNRFFEKSNLGHKERKKILMSENPYLELQKFIYETDPLVNRDIPLDEFKNKSQQIVIDLMKNAFQEGNVFGKKNTFLTCFSKKHDLILMWSYYTDSNKGICIQYDIKNYKRFVSRSCYPIKYEDGYDYTEELSNMKENMYKLMHDPYLKKETVWQHEKEWRILFNHEILLRSTIKLGDKHFLKLPKPIAIYMGKRIDPENEQKIMEICKNREISLYKMEKDNRRAKLYETEVLKFSEKNWQDELFVMESIKNKTCKSLIRNYFYYSRSIADIERGFSRIINAFNDLTKEDIQFFLDELLFKNDIFPTLYPYYYNVLLFLIKLYDCGSFNNIKTNDGVSLCENLESWIGYCISSFNDKKIVRYMIFFERLFMRFYNRYLLLNEEEKKFYDKKLPEFKLNNKYVSLFEEDLIEGVMYMHPFTTEDRTELVRDNILNNLQTLIDLFYENGEFDEKSCYKKYFYFKSLVRKIENDSEEWYNEILEGSERYLPIIYSSLFNEFCDFQLQASCSVLMRNKNIFQLLSDRDKHLFEVLGKINNAQHIAGFVNECCKELCLNLKYMVSKEVIKKYFNPKNNPYALLS